MLSNIQILLLFIIVLALQPLTCKEMYDSLTKPKKDCSACSHCGYRIDTAQVYAHPEHTAGLGWVL